MQTTRGAQSPYILPHQTGFSRRRTGEAGEAYDATLEVPRQGIYILDLSPSKSAGGSSVPSIGMDSSTF
jgi:hypothetical protein